MITVARSDEEQEQETRNCHPTTRQKFVSRGKKQLGKRTDGAKTKQTEGRDNE